MRVHISPDTPPGVHSWYLVEAGDMQAASTGKLESFQTMFEKDKGYKEQEKSLAGKIAEELEKALVEAEKGADISKFEKEAQKLLDNLLKSMAKEQDKTFTKGAKGTLDSIFKIIQESPASFVKGDATGRARGPSVPIFAGLASGQFAIVEAQVPEQMLESTISGPLGVRRDRIEADRTVRSVEGDIITLSGCDIGQWRDVAALQNVSHRCTGPKIDHRACELTLDTLAVGWGKGTYDLKYTAETPPLKFSHSQTGFVLELNVKIFLDALPKAAEVLEGLRAAYETLQPNQYMAYFDPVRFRGYGGLEESIRNSFQALSEARVYMRIDNEQVQRGLVDYQATFEIEFRTRAEPDRVRNRTELLTLRLEYLPQSEPGAWKITDFSVVVSDDPDAIISSGIEPGGILGGPETRLLPGIEVFPTRLGFGEVFVGTVSEPQTLTLRKTGTAGLIIEDAFLIGEPIFQVVAEPRPGR